MTDPHTIARHTSHLDPGQPINTRGAAAIASTRLSERGYEDELLSEREHPEGGWCVVYSGEVKQVFRKMPDRS